MNLFFKKKKKNNESLIEEIKQHRNGTFIDGDFPTQNTNLVKTAFGNVPIINSKSVASNVLDVDESLAHKYDNGTLTICNVVLPIRTWKFKLDSLQLVLVCDAKGPLNLINNSHTYLRNNKGELLFTGVWPVPTVVVVSGEIVSITYTIRVEPASAKAISKGYIV